MSKWACLDEEVCKWEGDEEELLEIREGSFCKFVCPDCEGEVVELDEEE